MKSWDCLANDEMAILLTKMLGILHHNAPNQPTSEKYLHLDFTTKKEKILNAISMEEYCTVLNIVNWELPYWELDLPLLVSSMLSRGFYNTYKLYSQYFMDHNPKEFSKLHKDFQKPELLHSLFCEHPLDIPMWMSFLGKKMTLIYDTESHIIKNSEGDLLNLNYDSSINSISVVFYYLMYYSGDLLHFNPVQENPKINETTIVKLLQKVFWISSQKCIASCLNWKHKTKIPSREKVAFASSQISKILKLVKEIASSSYHSGLSPLISEESLFQILLEAFNPTNGLYQDNYQLFSYSFEHKDFFQAAACLSNSCSESLSQSVLDLLSNKFIFGILPKKDIIQNYSFKIYVKFVEEGEAYQGRILSASKEIATAKEFYIFNNMRRGDSAELKDSEIFRIDLEYIINPVAGVKQSEKLDQLNEKLYKDLQYKCLKSTSHFNLPVSASGLIPAKKNVAMSQAKNFGIDLLIPQECVIIGVVLFLLLLSCEHNRFKQDTI